MTAARRLLPLLLACLLAGGGARAQLLDTDYEHLVRAAIEAYVRPALDAFSAAAAVEAQALEALCAEPSAERLGAARTGFERTAVAWAALEYLDLGPWRQEDRGPRIYFFPDRRGVTGRHLRRALLRPDPRLLEPEFLAGASVALQGLPALELLLFDEGQEALSDPDDSYRCDLAEAVSANLARLAEELRQAWAPGSPFPEALLHPHDEDVIARTPREAATQLFDRIPNGLEAIELGKLRAPLGETPEEAHPRRAAYHVSGLTNEVLAANLAAFQTLQKASGMVTALEAVAPDTAAKLGPAYDEAAAALAALDRPFGVAAADPETRTAAEALLAAVVELRLLAGEAALEHLGLRVYLIANDGD